MAYIPTPEEVHRLIIERAASDPEFRTRLLTSPREAVQEFFSDPIPEQVRITVVEEDPDEAILVLPPATSGTISDRELAGAATGAWNWTGGTSPGCNVKSCQYTCS